MAEEKKTIDWEAINAKLPYERKDDQKAKRKEIFDKFDVNSNGYLSLAEVGHTLALVPTAQGLNRISCRL